MKLVLFSAKVSTASSATLVGYFWIQYFLVKPDAADWIDICVYFFYFLAAGVILANLFEKFTRKNSSPILALPFLLPFVTAIIALGIFISMDAKWFMRLTRYGALETSQQTNIPAGFRGLLTLKNVRVVHSESFGLTGRTNKGYNYSAGTVVPVKNEAEEVVGLLDSAVKGTGFFGNSSDWTNDLPPENIVVDISGMVISDPENSAIYAEDMSKDRDRNWKVSKEIRRLVYVTDRQDFLQNINRRGLLEILGVLLAHWLICFVGLMLRFPRSLLQNE